VVVVRVRYSGWESHPLVAFFKVVVTDLELEAMCSYLSLTSVHHLQHSNGDLVVKHRSQHSFRLSISLKLWLGYMTFWNGRLRVSCDMIHSCNSNMTSTTSGRIFSALALDNPRVVRVCLASYMVPRKNCSTMELILLYYFVESINRYVVFFSSLQEQTS
jgi:hypothetical protein